MKLTDDELLAKIEHEERQALGFVGGDLANERSDNMQFYLGDKFGEIAAVEGRSSVVSTDVQEAIESVMPSLMRVFASGDEICRFDPVGPEDIEAADQESQYINYVAMNQNNGYLVMYNWFKDALVNKNAYVKYYWDDSTQIVEETYQGMTDEELAMLLQDDVEPVQHTSYVDEDAMQDLQEAANQGDQQSMMMLQSGQVPMLHDVRVKLEKSVEQVKIVCVPPEEIIVSQDSRDIDPNQVQFFEHRTYKTISDLREMGYEVEDDISAEDDLLYSPEWQARREFADEFNNVDQDYDANRRVVYREIYYNVDFDGDGISERRMVCVVGKKILANEVVEDTPFACVTPFVMPHKHFGRALADLVKDIQVIKTTVLRNVMDNFYHANNSRYAISDRVNLDDMLVSRPGGVVRVDGEPAGAIMPLTAQAIGPAAFPLIEYMDALKEKRTGVTAYNQGMDANSLNKTATGISQIMGAAQQRLELIARTFAETGVKQLFLGIHRLILQHGKKEEIVRLRGKWVAVDPRQWRTRTDMTVSVGLGTGNKTEQLSHIMSILQVQQQAIAIGIATPENIYNACMELTRNAGFKDADKYWTDPAQQQPQPPKPTPEEVKVQGELQKTQMQIQAEQQKFQAETVLKQQESEKQLQQEMLRSQNDVAIEQAKIEAQMELERFKAQLDAQVELEKTQMQVAAQQQMKSMEVTAQPQNPVNISTFDNEASGALMEALSTMLEQQRASQEQLIAALSKPKNIVRGPDGRVVGVQ